MPIRPENLTTPMGIPLLRPEFVSVGTNYFDQTRRDLMDETTEWSTFNYVEPPLSFENPLYKDNEMNKDIRFMEPLFVPDYTPTKIIPSKQAMRSSVIPMYSTIQLSQPWQNTFDGPRPERPKPIEDDDPFDRNMLDYLSPFNVI